MKPTNVSTKQQRIAELAKRDPGMAFKSLNHNIDYEWMQCAYEETRKDGAPGIDNQTAEDYAANLEQNLLSLMSRIKGGTYKAPLVRRHYIPKTDGSRRSLGIPCFEDKIAQKAVTMLLEPIYEQDFKGCSFGYRPKRSPHDALRAIQIAIMKRGCEWVLDVDLRKYFSSIVPSKLREMLAIRVKDGMVQRMINIWLKAGVFEDGAIHYPEAGTPEGGVISPILSNVYLHYVLDEWFEKEVQQRLKGESALVRFCDDFVMLFTSAEEAERVHGVLEKRLGKFGLATHPDKTQLVDFRRPSNKQEDIKHCSMKTTFDFLGFTHYWGKTRRGGLAPKVKTAKDRFRRAIAKINEQCRNMRNWPLTEQCERLNRMLKGHYQYYGVSDNIQSLRKLKQRAQKYWKKWLSRRSSHSLIRWKIFNRTLTGLLPGAKIFHKLY